MAEMKLAALRAYAVTRTLCKPVDLAAAVRNLGFVQIDPIRAPARAQDLILRHRVADYRAGDLEKRFPELPLVEDFVHVYGVLPESSLRLLHPRRRLHTWRVERDHPALARNVVGHIERNGPTHPRDLTRALGSARIVNGWGGSSAVTTRMLEALHYRGKLRVVRRNNGVKIYALAPARDPGPPLSVRAYQLLQLLVRLYAPLSMASLRQLAKMVTEDSIPEASRERALAQLLKSGWLARGVVEDVEYLWPADESARAEAPDTVRLLAPFDPIVWDRRRFARLWSWEYRFEAYTPPAKRRFGYYALPMLWRDRVIGWANVTLKSGRLDVATGFAGEKPRSSRFVRQLEREIDSLARSLGN
ncbi:MAG TPA: crosslink repair DNA glycosylase YcaQ family protein [Casimicrobiaceae bacterium]|jgi:hypothetical protein